MKLYQNNNIYIEKERSEIPWVKIFTNKPYKELGDVPEELRTQLWRIYDVVEAEMKEYYRPKKINMASFANMLPRVHIHVMARFEEDSHFPNPMWGKKLREAKLDLPDEDKFFEILKEKLQKFN